jgi:hypothetical protein
MSQVMQYGFPARDWLLCENPVCEEKATFVAFEVLPVPLPSRGKAMEIYGCTEHISQLTLGRPTMRLVKLKTPGERRVVPDGNPISGAKKG